MAGISYRRIRKGLRHALAPTGPERYAVARRPEERFYFRFKLVLAGVALCLVLLLIPANGEEGLPINEARLKPYAELAPGKAVVMLCINYMKERK